MIHWASFFLEMLIPCFLLSADDLKTQAQEEESELRIGFRDATHSDTCTKEGCFHYMPVETDRK